MSFCACGHDFTDHYQTDVEYLCLLCSWCDGYTKAAANDSATAPVPAGGTPEGLAREKVEMTDSEVKSSSPTTCMGRAQKIAAAYAGLDASESPPTEPCHPWEPHSECAYANGPNDSRSFEPWRCYRVGNASESPLWDDADGYVDNIYGDASESGQGED